MRTFPYYRVAKFCPTRFTYVDNPARHATPAAAVAAAGAAGAGTYRVSAVNRETVATGEPFQITDAGAVVYPAPNPATTTPAPAAPAAPITRVYSPSATRPMSGRPH